MALAVTSLLPAVPASAQAPAGSQPLPALYAVVDVQQGDELNIRAEPRAGASIIGSLPPQAAGIEVVGRRGNWLQVNTNEGSGWVAARFLQREAGEPQSGVLPERLACFGTEPFWSVEASDRGMVYSTPDNPDGMSYSIRQVTRAMNLPAPHWVLLGESQSQAMTAVVTPASCSDGMSDRAFALAATIVIDGGETVTALGGCCSIAPAP